MNASLASLALALLSPLALAGTPSASSELDCVVPPRPLPFERTQPDGTAISVRLAGSALGFWYETSDGYPVVEAQGWFVYAQLNADGELVPTRAVVGRDQPRSKNLTPRVQPRVAPHGFEPPSVSRETLLSTSGDLLPAGTRRGGPAPAASIGSFDNLVLLLRFADHGPGGQDRDLPSPSDVDKIMNAVGGDPSLAPTGSVRDHYLENSYGQLTINSTVVGWIDVPQTEAYYANYSSGLTEVTWELITDGLQAADAVVDFANFDADGDGWVDAITFLHSGYGAEWGGTDQYGTDFSDRMWSHKWTIPTFTSAEGVSVGDYNISPGLWGVSGDDPGRIGVVAHEIGHFFGLPDLYDTTGGGQGLGNWDVMAGGSWDFNSTQLYPSHMSAWSKITMGWINPTLILPGPQSAQQIETTPTAFRIDSGYPPGEYLLIENRQNVGFDSLIPQDGLAIYHVDETKGSLGANDPNGDEGFPGQSGWPSNGSHYRVAMLQADGGYEMELGYNRGDSGDIYHGFGTNSITNGTSPDTRAYQEGQLISNGNAIVNIANPSSSMNFVYRNFTAPNVTTGSLPNAKLGLPYSETLSATGGTGPIEWSEFRPNASYAQTDLGALPFASVGVAQGWNADDGIWPLALPFAFPYGETQYTRVYVSSNGFIDLAPTEAEPTNNSAYLRAATRIAPLWDNLTTDAGGDIYVDSGVAGQITIRWDAARWDTFAPASFAATLFADGAIEFHYGPGNTELSPTVGLSRTFGVHVDLVASHDGEGDLGDANSIRFELQGSELPNGVSLSTSGVLSGTPTETGTFSPILRATDSEWVYDQEPLTLEVDPVRFPGPAHTDPIPASL